MQTCLQLCRVLGNGCAARHTYISKYHMTRHRLLCRGATVYAASEAEYTKKPSRCKQVCRKHTYISKYHMTRQPSALPRRHSICGKRSEAEYTKKPARCKPVCNRAGFLETGVPQAHLYLKTPYDKTTVCALPRRYSICGKRSEAEYLSGDR